MRQAPTGLRGRNAVVGVIAMAALLGGCSGSGPDRVTQGPGSSEQPRQGGTLVLGASGEPACADWYAPCGNFFWGFRAMALQTLPTPVDFVDNQYRPSALLTGEPTVDAGPPQRVTYRLNPQAVWSDGVPITSADFKYSWEQGKAANFRGMNDISGVDDSDPKVAVVTWKDPSASWRDRFRPILPKHLLEGKDRNAEMKDGYSFSGGPFVIDHWTRGQAFKLVRNQHYWGKPANLDAVVFKIIPDSSAYQLAYKTGQVDMIVLPSAEPGSEELKSQPDTTFEPTTSLTYGTLVFNTQKAPLDSKAVRQAVGYATDRDAIVRQLFGQLQPDARPSQSVMSPANREWYTEAFARYRRDLSKVNGLMLGDGWAKGADGVWAKGEERARLELSVRSGSQLNDLLAQIVQSQWKDAGFDATVRSVAGTALTGDLVPKGNYQIFLSVFATGSTDPELCNFFCAKNIPTEANRFQGANVSRISSSVLDDAWERVNTELDPIKRRDVVRRGQELLAEEVPALPLAGVVDLFVSNRTKVGGPVSSSPALLRLADWYCKACG